MTQKRRNFSRSTNKRTYKKLFILACEGTKTEPQYFDIFSNQNIIKIEIINKGHSSTPLQALNEMRKHLETAELRPDDEAWLIIDKDDWDDRDILSCLHWAGVKPNRGAAISNPCFEFWLVLHFEEGNNINNRRDCIERLRQYLPLYDKRLSTGAITIEQAKSAVSRASTRFKAQPSTWPNNPGQTTVFQLVNKLLM